MADVKKGDLVRIEYTGRLASSGEVFETTDEQLAKKLGIFQEDQAYGPKLAAFGTNTIMIGLEEAILASQVGKEAEFLISPGKAFGERNNSLVRIMAERDFLKQQIRPVPGMVVSLDGALAKIKSVNSGRVVIDFNHPLAGEPVVYALKVLEVISEPEKKIEALMQSFGVKGKISKDGSKFIVEFDSGQDKNRLEALKNAIDAIVPGTQYKTG